MRRDTLERFAAAAVGGLLMMVLLAMPVFGGTSLKIRFQEWMVSGFGASRLVAALVGTFVYCVLVSGSATLCILGWCAWRGGSGGEEAGVEGGEPRERP